jgi:hypothetical protein
LSILRAVWNAQISAFANFPQGIGSQVSDIKQTLSIGDRRRRKIAVQSRGIGTTEREAHETS